MIISQIITEALLTYLIFSIIVFFLINSNLVPIRLFAKYMIDYPAEFKTTSNGVAYWKIDQNNPSNSVMLLHGFTRNSGRMNARGKYYWDEGFDLYFVDNMGHGKSKFRLFPSGIEYSRIIMEIIEIENLKKPILHGVSMGAIAAAFIAQHQSQTPKLIICEALPHNFDHLYEEVMQFMNIPRILFFWMDWFSKRVVWRKYKHLGDDYKFSNITVPFFLISSENDPMFSPKNHFEKIVNDFNGKSNFHYWLVPNASHSRMDRNDRYFDRLDEFIKLYA